MFNKRLIFNKSEKLQIGKISVRAILLGIGRGGHVPLIPNPNPKS